MSSREFGASAHQIGKLSRGEDRHQPQIGILASKTRICFQRFHPKVSGTKRRVLTE
jgi:hypothetical protein